MCGSSSAFVTSVVQRALGRTALHLAGIAGGELWILELLSHQRRPEAAGAKSFQEPCRKSSHCSSHLFCSKLRRVFVGWLSACLPSVADEKSQLLALRLFATLLRTCTREHGSSKSLTIPKHVHEMIRV